LGRLLKNEGVVFELLGRGVCFVDMACHGMGWVFNKKAFLHTAREASLLSGWCLYVLYNNAFFETCDKPTSLRDMAIGKVQKAKMQLCSRWFNQYSYLN
jgi:hypothetical protein